ncbi:MAG TPA: XrtA/PEP-CTERM system histidine kinase PrsK [Micropepsaceae bacterium]|jgi:putative PEP-CTERM system histidine kinase|nr:XrtA/PEP-CTERM system histidine kinase PrsK [Micropepsaceae bacterium]
MSLTLVELAQVATALSYAAFATLLLLRGARTWFTIFLVLAASMTAIWAGASVLEEGAISPSRLTDIAVPFRDGAWLTLILAIISRTRHSQSMWLTLVITTGCIVLLDMVFAATGLRVGPILGVTINSRATHVLTSIVGLMLVENMMRNLTRDQFWAVKLLGIGLVTIFLYELLERLPEFLTSMPVTGLAAALPLFFLMALPLFVVTAVRNPASALLLHSSRKIIFHSTALFGVGIMLQGTAAAAYYIKAYGGDNATVLSIVVGLSCVVAIAIAVTSSTVRSRVRNFINENFFSYKYDYRVEWNKFIHALSASDDGDMPLRVLRTLAELLDSPGGALWVYRESWHQFLPVAHWSAQSDLAPLSPDDPGLAPFKDEDCAYLQLAMQEDDSAVGLWRQRYPMGWLVVPLRYRDALIGVAVVNTPRAVRTLDWEDRNLISLVALQLAAYLVQEETVQALADARQLEEFNKRFAFILHDTKNTIGQLSLLVRNVETFGDSEEFRKDMIVTLRHSVQKLQGLLGQLRGDAVTYPAETQSRERVDLAALLASFTEERRKLGLNVELSDVTKPAFANLSNKNGFIGVLDHVVANAVEANPQGAPVNLRITISGKSLLVSVADTGPGMTKKFIAEQLFRPLRSTRSKGFGIGAYQAREVMRELGGNIEVRSKVGEGTTIVLSLPVAVPEAAEA